MKKKILTLILPAVAMITAACGETKPCNHKDDNKDHLCDLCGEKISEHVDENPKDHKCDICEQSMGEHADKNNDHNCDYCGAKISEHADNNHDHKCDVCNEKMSEHTAPNAEGKCDICGEVLVPPTPENKELEKFNELVASIKKNHNYTLTINSVVEGLEDQKLNCHRYNLNNKAWFHDNSEYFDAEGIVFQKGQGYITFAKNVDYIVPMSLADDFTYEKDPSIFVSTDPALNISDLTDVIGENLFIGDYTQDSTDKTKFSSTSIDNRAVAAYLTQYYDYISTGQLQISDKINAVVDVNNSKITLNLEYTLWYFDEVEVEAPGSISITLEDVGTTSDEVISAYIANPSYVFEAPTSWPEGMSSIFTELYNSVNPTIPSGLSYAAVCEKILYDGFYYAGIQDLNSGDLRTSYGQTLISEGFQKLSDDSYKKVVVNGVNSVTYKVLMKYTPASSLFPNGEMYILFRADKQSGAFESISDLNAYLTSKKYDELVPTLPNETTCTGITNFKDTTDNELYALKCNLTDTFRVNISDYAKASAFASAYAQALIEKGYSDTSKFLSMTNYSLEWSTAGSYVAIDFPTTEKEYTGFVGIRFVVWKVDEESLRPAPAAVLDHITVSEMSTSYEVGESFSFDGVCTAFYSDESFKVVEPTYVSKPDMTTTGQKTIIVKYSDHDVEKQTSYTINVSEAAAKLASLEISGFYFTQFVKDGTFNHSGMCVTAHYDDTSTKIVSSSASFDYDLSEAGIKSVTVSYTEDGKTVSTSYNILVSEGSLKWPGLSMATNEDVSLEGFYNLDFDTITSFNYNNSQSFIVAINTIAEIEDMYFDEDPDASIVLDYEYGSYKEYIVTPTKTLDVSSYTLVVQTKALTKYNLSVDSSIENGSLDLKGIAKAAAGAEVDVYYEADEGYEIESISAVDHPEIEISWYDYGGFYWFVMPEHDVELTATFKEIPQTHKLSFAQDLENGRVTTSKGITEVKAGEIAYFQAIPNAGYEVESVFVVGDDSIVPVWDKDNVYKFTMPNKDVTLCATFKAIPKTLTGIAISGQKTEFTVGDPFSVGDLVVTASYANGEKGTVTGYSVDSSKVDMSTAGDYKVTISYTEDGVTKSQEYVISVKGSDVTSTIYSGSMKVTTYDYSYTLTINSDGTGVYELTRTPSGGTASTYNQYFTWSDAGDGKINIVQDSSKTSTLCKNDKFNLWYDSSYDVPGSFKNTITISGNTASFTSHAYNDERTSATRELTLSLVA